MESLIKDAIVEHLKKHSLIIDSQHGFRPDRSCLTNLLKFLEELSSYIDQGYPVDVIYLDFSKAFDKVPHQHLMSKIEAHGISGAVSRWIKAWLNDRKQRLVVKGKESDWKHVCRGVPQGSVLDPTLFIIYINDIDKGIASTLLKFADDTKLWSKVATVEQAYSLQEDLYKLYEWSLEWQMLFNTEKCKVLHFGNSNPRYDYYMAEDLIESVSEEWDLGVLIHESLNPSFQCAKVVKTARRVLGMIRRAYDYRNKENIVSVYKSLVRPNLDYCVQAWRPYYQEDIDNIEQVQRRALKMINGFESMSYESTLEKAGFDDSRNQKTES